MADHAGSLINLTWSLNETASGLVTVAKSILQAANEDNVQPLAILAAEAFGATLAMAQESCIKAEKAARLGHTTTRIKFLDSLIGYSKTDSAAQLSKTNSGVRFLALASSLICLPSHETAAKALSLMINSNAGKDQILPSIGQLEDLLKALESKLTRVGFTARLMFWTDFLSCWGRQQGLRSADFKLDSCPSEKELQALTDTFRRVQRLGEIHSDEHPEFIIITTRAHFSWIITFVEWCNGNAPNIVIDDIVLPVEGGDPLIKVNLRYMGEINSTRGSLSTRGNSAPAEVTPDLEIRTLYSLDRLATLWNSGTPDFKDYHLWRGMIRFRDHGRRWMRTLELEFDIPNRITCELLCISLSLAYENLRPRSLEKEYATLAFSFLPSPSKITDALGLFLGTEPPSKLMDIKDFKSIHDVPLAKQYFKDLRTLCQCSKCTGNVVSYENCRVSAFEYRITAMAADILAMAQFDCPEPVLVFFQTGRYEASGLTCTSLETIISMVLFPSKDPKASLEGIRILTGTMLHCLQLVGHLEGEAKEMQLTETVVASSCWGQVFYPAMFESLILNGGNLCCLAGGLGQLRHHDVEYKIARDDWDASHAVSKNYLTPVDRVCNLFKPKDAGVPWKIELRNRYLVVSFRDHNLDIEGAPRECLNKASEALFVPQCVHGENARLNQPDDWAYYVTPLHPHPNTCEITDPRVEPQMVPVVAVAGNDALRFMALMSRGPAVIRGKACLECCLAICRKAGCRCIIL